MAIIGFLSAIAECIMTRSSITDSNIIVNDYEKICLEQFKITVGNRILMLLYQYKWKSIGCQECETN